MIPFLGLMVFLLINSAQGQTLNCTGKVPLLLPEQTYIPSYLCKDPRAVPNGGKFFDMDGGATRCNCWSFCGFKCGPNLLYSTTVAPTTTTTAVSTNGTTITTATPTNGTTTTTTAPISCNSGPYFKGLNDTIICFCVKGTSYYDCYPYPPT